MNDSPMIFGHRGARGYFPENTIDGFINAVKMGVTALEFDVIISKDSQVVVSHEPWFNHLTCTDPKGNKVKRLQQKNLYKLDYAEIKEYDCGKRGNPDFPKQVPVPAFKPLLKDVIDAVENYCLENNLPPVIYLVEIKSRKIGDGKFHPVPKKFAELVYHVLNSFHISDRIIVQSFDQRPLKVLHEMDPSLKLGLLALKAGSIKKKIAQLGFTPFAYGPSWKFIKKSTVTEAHALGLLVLAWTVNDEKKKKQLVQYGVDGIITDFPY